MYSQILTFIGASFGLLLLSRLGLVVWQRQRVRDVGGFWPIIGGGLRIDAHLIALGALPPLLVAPWLSASDTASVFTGLWLQAAWLLMCLLELSSPLFILEYDTRPNRLYVDYLKYPQEVFGMLWQGYKTTGLVTLLGLGLCAAVGHALFALPASHYAPAGWAAQLTLLLASGLLVFLAIRGTLRHRPINPSTVAFCGDPLLNTLALNSLYSVIYALYCMKNERSSADAYGTLPPETVVAQVRTAARLAAHGNTAAIPTLHRQHPMPLAARPRPRHLVLIVEESLGAQYTGHLGGRDLTPHLDALSRDAWTFTQAYATGTRSVRGLEALVAGFPPALSDAVLRLPNAQTRFFTLAQLLRTQGFRSRFVYGGEAHFDNMKGFFLGNGFDELHDRAAFQSPQFVGTWGVSDEDMFARLHDLLSAPGDQPTFTLAFSVSNHSPWQYPAGRITPAGDPATVENSVRYADWALGQFFARARNSPYWDDTLFLVVADHEARVGGQQRVPVQYFHIPAMILGGGITPRQDARLISQIDLPVTLLSLMGIEAEHPMIGHDLTDPGAGGRALMQYGEYFGYLKGQQLAVLAPLRPATQWHYTAPGHYAAAPIDAAFAQEALAHALWPDLVYRQRSYTLPHLLPSA